MMRTVLLAAGLMLILLVGGCRSLTPPVTHYTLNVASESAEETVDNGNGRLTVGIRPVELPGYVNRLQMVTRSGSNQLKVSDLHRWADYPDRLVQQALSGNLQWLMPRARVVSAPWPVEVHPDVVLAFQFLELVGTAEGRVVLNVVWSANGTAPESATLAYRTALSVPITGNGFDGLAEAHSRALETLSRNAAEVLQNQFLKD